MEACSKDSLLIPPIVPYLGHAEKYFLGSGIAGGGGDPDGVWDYLIGPGYTFYGYIKSCESFIRREEIKLVIDGIEVCPTIEMHRARGTGMFCGAAEVGGLKLCLIDFTNNSEPWVSRLLIIDNNSAKNSRDVSARAYVTPGGVSDSIVADTAVTIAHGCNIPDTTKNAILTFTDPSTSVVKDENTYILETGTVPILPGQRYVTALYHYTHFDEVTPGKCIEEIRAKKASVIADDLGKCIDQWTEWLKEGEQPGNIADQKIKDIVESAIVIMKMLQGDDGGLMATPRSYMDSYARDAAGAFSGLIATGHTKEAEKFMLCVEHKYNITGMIPCNANIGDDAYYFPGYGTEENWAAETPALYLLIARDYYRKMQEKGMSNKALDFLKRVDKSLLYAMDVQLCSLIKNDWKLYFNGDETECGGSGIRIADITDKKERIQCWSMPSLALCGASLDFFITWLTDRGAMPMDYTIGITGQTVNLYDIMDNIKSSMDDNFWRTDIPEHPGGFYDWYRTKDGGLPRLRITNFSIFPLFYKAPLNHPERAVQSATAMKRYFNDGYMPIQPGGLSEDYCGHNLGYLLYALVEADDPMMHEVFTALTEGVSMGCWGMWSEAYKADGTHYTLRNSDFSRRTANMRPFESGINVAAILKYVEQLYNREGIKYMKFPDVLTALGGAKINNPAEWEDFRRKEILSLFEEFVFGRRPPQCCANPNFDRDTGYTHPFSVYMECEKVMVEVSGYSFPVRIFLPKNAQKPVPVFVYIMHCYQSDSFDIDADVEIPFLPIKSIVNNGFGLAVVRVADVAYESERLFKQGVLVADENGHYTKQGVFAMFGSDKENGWGEISAWGWGMSKAVDYLETVDIVDKNNIYAIGHSRGGKTALWAGATDTRFSLVISNNSGCTGASLSRGNTGETIKDINTVFPNWFCGNYKKFNDNEYLLPIDQHMLLALVAPRKLYVASASADLWCCPANELISCRLASNAYELYGKNGLICDGDPMSDVSYNSGSIGYHIRTGKHSLTSFDWDMYMRFAKKDFI